MDWFRMYSEARNDAKLRSLTDSQHRVWFNLLCLTNEQDNRGVLADFDDELLAVEVANGDTDLLRETLDRLQRLRIIEIDEEWTITFVNFKKRNYDKPSDTPEATRERKRRQRERDNNQCHANVTPCHDPYSDTDTDTDTDKTDHDDRAREEKPNFATVYEQEFGTLISPLAVERLQGYINSGIPEELVCEAIMRTKEQGKVSLKYTYSILDDWRNRGIINLAGVEIADQEFKQRKRSRAPTGDLSRHTHDPDADRRKELIKRLYAGP